jgi:hypothetical protein
MKDREVAKSYAEDHGLTFVPKGTLFNLSDPSPDLSVRARRAREAASPRPAVAIGRRSVTTSVVAG